MARQNRSNTATEAPAEETPVTEAPAEETPVTEASAEAPAEEPKAEEKPIDLEPFKAAVTETLTEADASTGQIPEGSFAKVNEIYRNLDGQKAKNAARGFLEEKMLEAVGKLEAQLARSYNDIKSNLSAAGGTKAEKAPADPTAAFVQRVAALQIGYGLAVGSIPENVAEDWQTQVEKLVGELTEQVASYQTWLNTEVPEGEEKPAAPEVSPVVRNAFKLSTGKASGKVSTSGGTSSGVRHDISKHIQSAFVEVEEGTFLTVAEIAKHKSAEYGDDTPSQGAVSARLFPQSGKCTVAGVEPVEAKSIDGKNPKGARKVA